MCVVPTPVVALFFLLCVYLLTLFCAKIEENILLKKKTEAKILLINIF
nr:MAG TPA: hypothetical protein [Caudoviricetes sp.]